MKKILLAIPFAVLVGCSGEAPTPENHCCMEVDCHNFFTNAPERAKCLYTMVKDLEKKVEVNNLKMHYECGETK